MGIMSVLVYVLVVILVPLLPTFVLFRALPSRAALKGPFRGWKVNFGGAFAGYVFVLVFITYSFRSSISERPYRKWVVKGAVSFMPSDGSANANDITCYIRPPQLVVDQGNNSFTFEVPVRDDDNDDPEFPQLVFLTRDHKTQTAYILNPGQKPIGVIDYGAKIDSKHRLVTFTKPVLLERTNQDPPYRAGQVAEPTVRVQPSQKSSQPTAGGAG
jgi:hypothetical protein